MALETNKQYDMVVGTIMQNVFAEHKLAGKIILWDFQEKQDLDRLYFNVAAMVSDLIKEPIYIQMPLFKYLKMKWKRRKTRKNLRYLTRWAAKDVPFESRTSVFIIMDFIREFYQVDLDYFKKINDEYYGWVE